MSPEVREAVERLKRIRGSYKLSDAYPDTPKLNPMDRLERDVEILLSHISGGEGRIWSSQSQPVTATTPLRGWQLRALSLLSQKCWKWPR